MFKHQSNDQIEATPKKKVDWVREGFSLGFIVLAVFAFKSSIIANYTVPTPSMVPNIQVGEKLIVNKMAYNLRVPFTDIVLFEIAKPERSDVVVFDNPRDRSISFVKRLIGLPGDVVTVTDGLITVNGQKYGTSLDSEEELFDIILRGGQYTEIAPTKSYTVQRGRHFELGDVQTYTVPEGQYFFMGDNREASSDSRSWGFVPYSHIKGKAKFIYLSLDWPEGVWIPKIRSGRFMTWF